MNTSRVRVRESINRLRYFNQFGQNYFNDENPSIFEYFSDELSSTRTSFNPCFHINIKQPFQGRDYLEISSNYVTRFSDPRYEMDTFKLHFDKCFTDALSTIDVELDFQKNNSFELLSFIGELDDFIALFTLKFWKSLSYGSFNWGILPLISDIKSLLSSYDDIFNGGILDALNKFNTKRFSAYRIKFDVDDMSGRYKFDGLLRLHGFHSVQIPDFSDRRVAITLLLDELGAHPDIATIWNLIPLSFIVDYFLPIGDILESLHPRGWFRPTMLFTGTASLSGKLIEFNNYGLNTPSRINYLSKSEAECFARRTNIQNDLSFNDLGIPRDYSFGLSLRQLFNLGYLSKDRLKGF